jgi:predicted anti-sigma-YlaC factor YlaD
VLDAETEAFKRDNDPELVGQALPFTLKTIDGLLLREPDRRQLLLAGASGYVTYAYAYILSPAERVSLSDIDRARELRGRARNLFLRGHDYAARALEQDYPGVTRELTTEPDAAVKRVGGKPARDVETLYWAAAGLGLAISSSRNEAALLARLPEVEAMLSRALELDESWDNGALHEFAISLAAVDRQDAASLERHYQRAVALSAGRRASVYVSYAEAVARPRQDRPGFVALLDRALAVDVDADPDERLANVVAQDQARWLKANLDEMFLE